VAIALITGLTGSGGSSTAATTFTVSKNANVANNCVMYLAVATNNSSTTWVQAKNTDSTWTRLGTGEDNATVNVGLSIFRRVVTTASSEPSSYAFSNVNHSNDSTTVSVAYEWVMIGLSGVDNTTPEDVTMPAFTGNASTPTVTAVTPVTAGAWVIAFAASDQTTTITWSAPTGYSNLVSGTTGRAVALATIAWSGSGSQPSTTFGVGSGTNTPAVGNQVAVRPSGAAARQQTLTLLGVGV
jgi:hypothetical protein